MTEIFLAFKDRAYVLQGAVGDAFNKYTYDYTQGEIKWVPERSTTRRVGMNLQNQPVSLICFILQVKTEVKCSKLALLKVTLYIRIYPGLEVRSSSVKSNQGLF